MKTDTVISKTVNPPRDSGIELFRIILMLVIVANHYFVHSNLSDMVAETGRLTFNSVFLMIFGGFGKTGINCFILITGYFMCKSDISLRKFLRIYLWMLFYRVLWYIVFTASGQQPFSAEQFIRILLPIMSVSADFNGTYLAFFLFIPFINILIKGMDKKKHLILIVLGLALYTVFATLGFKVIYNYITWFSIVYLIGAYIRSYPEKWFDNKKLWGAATIVLLLIAFISIIGIAVLTLKFNGKIQMVHYFVGDSNKPLAVLVSISAFMFFKNINIGYHKWINNIAASSFGVLEFHTTNRNFINVLWNGILHCGSVFASEMLVVHAIVSVLGVYAVGMIFDKLRNYALEKPFFKWYDKRFTNKKVK